MKITVFLKSRAGEQSRKTDTMREIKKEQKENRLHKRDKTTEILFDETNPIIEKRTHNTGLKKRLTTYAAEYPDLSKLTDEDTETSYMSFQIAKRRFSVRLTKRYSDERRLKASECAKKLAHSR